MKNICYEQFLRDFRPLIEALLSCNEDLEEVRAGARTSAKYHAKGFDMSRGDEVRDRGLAEVAEKYGIYNYLPSDEEGTPRFKSDEEREHEVDFLTEEPEYLSRGFECSSCGGLCIPEKDSATIRDEKGKVVEYLCPKCADIHEKRGCSTSSLQPPLPQPQEELFVSSERGTFQTKCKQCGETFRENSAGQALRNLMKHMKFAHGVSL
jgi:Zn-finger protein